MSVTNAMLKLRVNMAPFAAVMKHLARAAVADRGPYDAHHPRPLAINGAEYTRRRRGRR